MLFVKTSWKVLGKRERAEQAFQRQSPLQAKCSNDTSLKNVVVIVTALLPRQASEILPLPNLFFENTNKLLVERRPQVDCGEATKWQ